MRGNVDDREIEVLHTGVGERVCREHVGKFLPDQQFELLISTGFAGALDHQLGVGDLLLAKNFSTIDLSARRLSLSNLPIHIADLLTVSALIDSTDERNKIARTSGAAAVDMETGAIAAVCNAHGIPLLSLRAISDSISQPFPAPPKVLFDIERQRTHVRKLAMFFLAHPTRVPRLVQFAKRIARARTTLANALLEVVRAIG